MWSPPSCRLATGDGRPSETAEDWTKGVVVVLKGIAAKFTYANVIASLALFLALSGGVVWAAGKIGPRKLKANAVTAGKIKANAVTAKKIRRNAVTTAKIRAGAVDLTKLAAGTNLVGIASGGPVAANGGAAVAVPLVGTASFTSQQGVLNLLSVEGSGSLARTGEEACQVTVVPFVNGSAWGGNDGELKLKAAQPTPDFPTGLISSAGITAPLGLAAPGTAQTVTAKVFGDPDCTPTSTVTVAIAVTRAK